MRMKHTGYLRLIKATKVAKQTIFRSFTDQIKIIYEEIAQKFTKASGS